MNVCMIAYSHYESDNRIRRYAETLARRGDTVDVIALRGEHAEKTCQLNGVNVYRIQKRIINEHGKFTYLFRLLKFFVKSFYWVSRFHFKRPYDLIHVHSVPDFEVFAAVLPKLWEARVILDIHDLVPEFYRSKFKSEEGSFFFKSLKWVEKLSAKFSDHIIISNHLWEKVLVSRSVPPEKCTTILNYPDQSIFHKRPLSGGGENKVILLYPGTINWHQGLDIAVKAFALIKDQVPEAEFHIYGDGPNKTEVEELVAFLGLNDRILLKGKVSLDEIASIMAQSHIGIIPKRNDLFGGEAFSTKTLEFMALGVPIILSRTKIDSFYFNDAIATFFEPENIGALSAAMLKMIKNPEERRRQAEKASKYLENNNWGVKKHIYLDLVDSLVGKTGTVPNHRCGY